MSCYYEIQRWNYLRLVAQFLWSTKVHLAQYDQNNILFRFHTPLSVSQNSHNLLFLLGQYHNICCLKNWQKEKSEQHIFNKRFILYYILEKEKV